MSEEREVIDDQSELDVRSVQGALRHDRVVHCVDREVYSAREDDRSAADYSSSGRRTPWRSDDSRTMISPPEKLSTNNESMEVRMATRTLINLLAVLLLLSLPEVALAADPAVNKQAIDSLNPPSATTSMKGQVLKIEPDALILGTDGGGQVRLKINKDTKVERALKVGDKVEAEVGANHQLVALKLAP